MLSGRKGPGTAGLYLVSERQLGILSPSIFLFVSLFFIHIEFLLIIDMFTLVILYITFNCLYSLVFFIFSSATM